MRLKPGVLGELRTGDDQSPFFFSERVLSLQGCFPFLFEPAMGPLPLIFSIGLGIRGQWTASEHTHKVSAHIPFRKLFSAEYRGNNVF